MSTYRELIHLVLDELKLASDDAFFNEEHVMFLLGKYRGFLLYQKYKNATEDIPESNYQTLCLDLIQVPAITGEECEGGTYLRSKEKIPTLSSLTTPKVYTKDYYQGDIAFVSRERVKYVGYNRWLKNIIYASLGPDNYLYFKSFNPQYLYLEEARLTAIFEDPEDAAELECDKSDEDSTCDPMDSDFPLEEDLIPQCVELVVKELSGGLYKPEDSENDANDNLADLAAYLRRMTKNDLQRQLDT